ncbi:sialoadhesin-like isoform X4 [Thunnus maccoyii]|uniref:sialoadhesin-like isoform X4 n=1 Tax=Thunnus maccoyii TaxID=8240 RepID=UPI001C4B6862|nr:sialoadhesin-like isoform X4 [Thunnus maccoyii]
MEITILCTVVASLRVLPNKSQFFQYESFSLSCGEPGKSSHWRVIKNTSTLINEECRPSLNERNESHCLIDDLYPSDTGVYWCESGAGECSNTINITVAAGPVILESPVLPVMEGDDVTLSCKNINTTSSSNLTTNFYKNGFLMATSSTGNITIHSISKSDEGFYKCNISGVGQSPDSWLAVRGKLNTDVSYTDVIITQQVEPKRIRDVDAASVYSTVKPGTT